MSFRIVTRKWLNLRSPNLVHMRHRVLGWIMGARGERSMSIGSIVPVYACGVTALYWSTFARWLDRMLLTTWTVLNIRLHYCHGRIERSFSVRLYMTSVRSTSRGADPGCWRSWPPWKYVESMFWPPPLKMPHSFIQNCFWITLKPQIIKDERLVSKMKGRTVFEAPIQAVRNRDCWVFGNHWRRV